MLIRTATLALYTSILFCAPVVAQDPFTFTDNFDSADTSDYVFVDSIGQLTGTDFAELLPTGGRMRVTAPTTPDLILGPARSGFEFKNQPRNFSDFEINVDLVDWDDSLMSGFGPTARTRGVGGIGTLDMYSMAILTNTTAPDSTEISDFVVINRFDNEAPITLVAEPIALDPSKQYRMSFSGSGPNFEAKLFDLADVTVPVVELTAVDDTYHAGGNGIALGAAGLDPAGWTLPDARADVTFDNYSITATVPEPTSWFTAVLPFVIILNVCHRWRRRI